MYGVIISGMPCSGKSTIAKKYAERHKLKYISSGDIAREMAQQDITIHRALEKGFFAPEEEMRSRIEWAIVECAFSHTPFIMDGFPRFKDQDVFLHKIFDRFQLKVIYVLIDVDIDVCLDRARRRQRNDDAVIKDRIDYFYHTTLPPIMSHSPIIMGDTVGKDNDDIVNLLNGYITMHTHRDTVIKNL
jgi:adenylate kinase family enzyme